MRLRVRYLLSLLAVMVLMALPALYGLTRVADLRDIVLELRDQTARSALAVGRLRAAIEEFDYNQRAYVAFPDSASAERMRMALTQMRTELDALRAAGFGDALTAASLPISRLDEVSGRTGALVRAGLMDAATTYLRIAAMPLVEQMRGGVPALAQAIDVSTMDRVARAERSANAAQAAATTAILITLVVAAALAVAFAGVLTRPLERLRRAMANVADGTFEAPPGLPYERRDEIGELFRSFRAMTLKIAELDRLKAEFVGIASHELKTPISVITGYAELMKEEFLDEMPRRHRELLTSLAEQTQTLQRRVDQLLEISRMEAGRLRLGLEEIYLGHFVQGLQREHEPVARTRDIRFRAELGPDAPPFLVADPDVLRADVLGNLIGNALKFTPAGGEIDVVFRGDGDRLIVEVVDNGPGIPDDHVEHIFEKYWQGRGARGGAGLGLAIARAAVEAHGGRIDVRSRVGRGTRFRIMLPVRAELISLYAASTSREG